MRYSPIKSFRVKDFRNIGEVNIDFKESPIVTLIGDNEAGKTSIIKAFAVLAYHTYLRDQKEFIRDGKSNFEIEVEFEDGTTINRRKGFGASTNYYRVIQNNSKVYETNKIDSGIPVIVSDIMGMIEETETGELLQVRTYEDKLLFVVTPASTNYKVIYNALKVDNLTRAVKLGIEQSNEVRYELSRNEESMETLVKENNKIKIFDLEPLTNIKERLISLKSQVEKMDQIIQLQNKVSDMQNMLSLYECLENADLISFPEVSLWKKVELLKSEIAKMNMKLENVSQINNVEIIDYALVKNLNELGLKINMLRTLTERFKKVEKIEMAEFVEDVNIWEKIELALEVKNKGRNTYKLLKLYSYPNIQEVDYSMISKMDRAMIILAGINRETEELEEALKMEKHYNEKYKEAAKEIGAIVVECDSCGNEMVLDTKEHELRSVV